MQKFHKTFKTTSQIILFEHSDDDCTTCKLKRKVLPFVIEVVNKNNLNDKSALAKEIVVVKETISSIDNKEILRVANDFNFQTVST